MTLHAVIASSHDHTPLRVLRGTAVDRRQWLDWDVAMPACPGGQEGTH